MNAADQALFDAARALTRAMRAPAAPWTNAHFDALALRVYEAQRGAVAPYDAWCAYELGERGTSAVTTWRDIPALPISAFKSMRVASGHVAVATWLSSGTTARERSRHELADTTQYELSLDRGVEAALVPDVVAGSTQRLRCIQLQPSARGGATQSSLTHMYDRIRRGQWCRDGGTFVNADFQLDADGAWRALQHAAEQDEPVLLLTTSFALAMLFDAADAAGWDALELPQGSRVVDTGGYKGRTRELTRAQLVELICARLGVGAQLCENEYGMSELSSQCWLGNVAAAVGHSLGGAPRWMPPWLRVRVVDPTTLEEVGDGEEGLLVFHDLANVWSCAAIRSEDFAVRRGTSFELLGRAPGAALKGCSLQLEELL